MPTKKISPAVITSRIAAEEMDIIRLSHKDILMGMANQKMKKYIKPAVVNPRLLSKAGY